MRETFSFVGILLDFLTHVNCLLHYNLEYMINVIVATW